MRWAIVQIPSMAIDGPSMPIGKSCDGHRWAIDGIEWSLSAGMVLKKLQTCQRVVRKL